MRFVTHAHGITSGSRVWPAVTVAIFLASGAAAAEETPRSSESGPAELSVIRFEFDNDTFLDSDNGFTAGWSLQYHTAPRPGLVAAVRHLPGFGGRSPTVRWSFGLSQLMVTPDDLSVTELQPLDAPYAGTLGVHAALAAFDNERLAAAQLYVGCRGPCSGAEETQKLIHELVSSAEPQGWDNQLDTELLANLNLEGRWKLWAPSDSAYAAGRWAGDVSVGGQIGLGNLATFAQAQVEARFGRGLPMGFTHVPDPPGLGVALDPIHFANVPSPARADRSFHAYASVVLRAAEYEELVAADGGRTRKGERHPGVETAAGNPQAIVGVHFGKLPIAVHLNYYRYLSRPDGVDDRESLDWVNVSFEWRF